jgi:cytochrome c553
MFEGSRKYFSLTNIAAFQQFLVLGTLFVFGQSVCADSQEEQLLDSIKSKDYQEMKRIVSEGANVNADDGKALGFALVLKDKKTLEILTAAGADIDAKVITTKAGCVRCHSVNEPGVGLLNSNGPHLAAQNKEYLIKQMNDFHIGNRQNTTMDGFSNIFVEPIVKELAAYYSSLQRYEHVSDVAAEILVAGQDIYESKCQECHGADGISTTDPLTPTLAGQNPFYSIFQMVAYRDGVRSNDEEEIMRSISAELTKDEIEAVAEYMQNLK